MNNSLIVLRSSFKRGILQTNRVFSTISPEIATNAAEERANQRNAKNKKSLPQLRFAYPEFLPDPKMDFRNRVKEALERKDMMSRRCKIDIPEFYVGSVLAVTTSDLHAVNKKSRFVGICILREFCGLNARFLLRNVIDHQGVEVMYELYDPTVQKIEVLRLEKRLDDNLLYLRDSLPEFSTFDFDMDPEVVPENAPIPVNEIKVKLKPRPWSQKWERQNLQGVENLDELTYEVYKQKAQRLATPWEKYDLMKEYRRTIPEEEQNAIFAEVAEKLTDLELNRKKTKKRTFLKPKKLA